MICDLGWELIVITADDDYPLESATSTLKLKYPSCSNIPLIYPVLEFPFNPFGRSKNPQTRPPSILVYVYVFILRVIDCPTLNVKLSG